MNRKAIALFALFVLIVTLFGAAFPARAGGLLIVEGVYRQPAVSHVKVSIEAKIATTTVEQTFRNPLPQQVTAVYAAPVPEGATILTFAQFIDGQWVEADVKDKDEAQKAFDDAAAKGQDAGLTTGKVTNPGKADASLNFQTQIILPANAERKIRLVYTEVLTAQAGVTRYAYHLAHTNLTDEPIGDLLVQVTIKEKEEIRAVYSPSHNAGTEIAREGKSGAVATYRAQNVVPDQNYELVYTQSAAEFGLNLASYRDPKAGSEDGYFVLIAAPQLEVKSDAVVKKDFVFVLDRSGSMNGPKFTAAKIALKNILKALNTGDRFNVISFSSDVTRYASGMVTLAHRENALNWVDQLRDGGGTNINDSLIEAANTVDAGSERPHIIVFLTDGMATVGETNTGDILKNVRAALRPQSRVYTIGVGEVNTALLEALSSENRGRFVALDPFLDLTKPLADFYASIDSPVLVDLAVDFGGVEVYDLYPNPIPDMFLGGQVVLTGRYKGDGLTTVKLTGKINGKPHVSEYKDIAFVSLKDTAAVNSFAPRLWAQRKVEGLLRQIALGAQNPEKLIEEIRALGLKYKIATPYTSFIVTAPDAQNTKSPFKTGTQLPKAGLPFLYTDDYRTVNTLLIGGGLLLILIGAVGVFLSRRR